ncbi:MAG: tRNA (adenosine(37)-N6)-threonylcarbamoyltransferase complex ATPase subunit type 1 TsaE [Bacillota bacterium]
MTASYSLITGSKAETKEFATKLANLITSPALILLKGELGTGKTLITKAAVAELGYQGDVTSPTFNLVQEYQADTEIIHMDLYRLEASDQLLDIGFEDYLDREAIIFIEWPDLALALIPANFIFIEITKIAAQKRKIIVRGEGAQSKLLVERLNKEC